MCKAYPGLPMGYMPRLSVFKGFIMKKRKYGKLENGCYMLKDCKLLILT
jgi:hypothetical protein